MDLELRSGVFLHLMVWVCASEKFRSFLLDIEEVNNLNKALEATVEDQKQIINVCISKFLRYDLIDSDHIAFMFNVGTFPDLRIHQIDTNICMRHLWHISRDSALPIFYFVQNVRPQ